MYNKGTQPAQACVLWMHGLGASASDMVGLADQLVTPGLPLRHVFLDAPRRPVTINAGRVMPAWYDIMGTELLDRVDSQGIAESEAVIREALDVQLAEGLEYPKIFLAGFSQGGAMALHTALNLGERLAGVIALSAYLPSVGDVQSRLDKKTPFFMASGRFDPLVLPIWTLRSKEWLLAQGYHSVSFYQYPMEHSVCLEEVKDLSKWIVSQCQGARG